MNAGEDLLCELRSSSSSTAPSSGPRGNGSAASRENPGRRQICPSSQEWPSRLREMGTLAPPECLYVEGCRLDAEAVAIAVVGTRRPTAAGVEAAEELTRGLVEAGFVIVSGMAIGIDAVAHRTALAAGGRTIGVLGCGLDVDYPRRNRALKRRVRSLGTLVTEYPEGTQPHAQNFPARNRIVAGMCAGVLVVEGGLTSGARITATRGVEANRSVWAVPGSIRNPMAEGPNDLIRTLQANLVTKVEHICAELAPSLVWDRRDGHSALAPESLSNEERAVLLVLDDVVVPPDRVGRLTGLAPGEVAMALSSLEVRGYVIRRQGGYEIGTAGARIRRALVAANDAD